MDEMLQTAPKNIAEALALIFVEKNATANSTPDQLLQMYQLAYGHISATIRTQTEVHYKEI